MEEALIKFIINHENDDLTKLLLKHREILGHPTSFVANQINGRRRAKEKLPTWFANPATVYPPQQNLEQCSSEATARFKCEVISGVDASLNLSKAGFDKLNLTALADLTGGFGVDSLFFSRIFSTVFHVESDPELCEIARKNHELLESSHGQQRGATIEFSQSTAEEFLSRISQQLDWIYLDPSRKSNGKKVVRLSDSQPDVVALLPNLFLKSDNILIKTSPLLDLKEGLKQLPRTREIFVVSVSNECKEVLFRLQKNWTNEPEIVCVNLIASKKESFRFKFSEEASSEPEFSDPLTYLYEPNASILKAGAFKSIAKTFGVFKIAVSTHLYTSENYKSEFPGRIFKLLAPLSVEGGVRAFNVISRNHPLSPEEIKKKFKLKDGGDEYVLAFSGRVKKFLMMAERVR